mgnify:CR=1 FL=1
MKSLGSLTKRVVLFLMMGNEDGEPTLDAKPFLNDEGLPIDADGNILEESHKEQDKPKKKRGRPAKVKAETTTAEDT